jgi:hypothetical protein
MTDTSQIMLMYKPTGVKGDGGMRLLVGTGHWTENGIHSVSFLTVLVHNG